MSLISFLHNINKIIGDDEMRIIKQSDVVGTSSERCPFISPPLVKRIRTLVLTGPP